MVSDVVADSVVPIVLTDDEKVIKAVDVIAVVVTEKDFDDSKTFSLVDVVRDCASEECKKNGAGGTR